MKRERERRAPEPEGGAAQPYLRVNLYLSPATDPVRYVAQAEGVELTQRWELRGWVRPHRHYWLLANAGATLPLLRLPAGQYQLWARGAGGSQNCAPFQYGIVRASPQFSAIFVTITATAGIFALILGILGVIEMFQRREVAL